MTLILRDHVPHPTAESVIGHVKDEEVWIKEYIDFQDAYSNLSYFLDVFYNHERIHSSLGYITGRLLGHKGTVSSMTS